MNNSVFRVCIALCLFGLVAGCGNKQDDTRHGTSTRSAGASAPAPAQPVTSFGEPMRLSDTDATPLAKVLADPTKYQGKYVRVVGDVNKVCTSKGCWLEMASPGAPQPLFVKFTCPIEGRLIPTAAVGKPVAVEGFVRVKEISEEEARHLKEESGAPASEVVKITVPQKQVTLDSPAAQIVGL